MFKIIQVNFDALLGCVDSSCQLAHDWFKLHATDTRFQNGALHWLPLREEKKKIYTS